MSNDASINEIPMPFHERYAELTEIIDEFCNPPERRIQTGLRSTRRRPVPGRFADSERQSDELGRRDHLVRRSRQFSVRRIL